MTPPQDPLRAARQAIRDRFFMDVPKASNFTVDLDYQTCYEEVQDTLEAVMEEFAAALLRQDEPGPLDAAWAEAEAALPEGWAIVSLYMVDEPEAMWRAFAGDRANPDPEGPFIAHAFGPTPAAALLALAAALRAVPA